MVSHMSFFFCLYNCVSFPEKAIAFCRESNHTYLCLSRCAVAVASRRWPLLLRLLLRLGATWPPGRPGPDGSPRRRWHWPSSASDPCGSGRAWWAPVGRGPAGAGYAAGTASAVSSPPAASCRADSRLRRKSTRSVWAGCSQWQS